jgi:hypothetical protein
MKTIILPYGRNCLVDDEDFDSLARFRWNYRHQRLNINGFWERKEDAYCEAIKMSMQNLIMGPKKNFFVFHKNGNSLDNRRENLIILTRAQFEATKPPSSRNTTGIKGVSWKKNENKWYASIRVNKSQKFLGLYSNIVEAAMKYNEAAVKYFGEFAYINTQEIIDEKKIRKDLRITEKVQLAKNYKFDSHSKKLREKKISKRLRKKDAKNLHWEKINKI